MHSKTLFEIAPNKATRGHGCELLKKPNLTRGQKPSVVDLLNDFEDITVAVDTVTAYKKTQ